MSTFEEVLKVFGGSLFSDNYRADLQSVCKHLELSEPTGESYGEENASYDLLYSVYHALCGKNALAISVFQNILDHLDLLPRRWELRCLSYRVFHLNSRRHPAILRFRTEYPSMSRWMHDATFSERTGLQLMGRVAQLTAELEENLLHVDKVEARVMLQLITNNFTLLRRCFLCHPAHPPGVWNLPEFRDRQIKILTTNMAHLTTLTSLLVQGGFHRLAADTAMQQVDVLFGCGDKDEAKQQLLQILQHCIEHRDEAGQAVCKMVEADMIISPPFSSPIALNLIALDGSDHSIEHLTWDSCEDVLVLTDDDGAEKLYAEALHLFEQCGSSRGCAAIKLRQSGINLARMAFGTVPTVEAYQEHVKLVETNLHIAARLYDQDEAGGQIVRAHQIMLNILQGQTECVESMMADIGDWGRHNHNEIIAHFVGYLILRFGRRHWKDHNRVDIALSCFSCAETLFRSLQDPIAVFQSINARAELHEALQNTSKAKNVMKEGMKMFDQVQAEIDQRIATAKDELTQESLPSQQKLLMFSYDAFVRGILHNSGDLAEIVDWQRRTATWEIASQTAESPGHSSTTWTAVVKILRAAFSHIVKWDMVRRFLGYFGLQWGQWAAASRMLLPPRYRSKSTETIHDQAKQVVALSNSYRRAMTESGSHLSNFDVDNAKKIQKDFCREVEALNIPWSSRASFAVLASFLHGDRESCARYQSFVPEAEDMLCITSIPVFTSQERWCRSTYNRRLREQRTVETALAVSVMANNWDRAARLLKKIEEASPGYLDPAGPDGAIDQWTRYIWAGLIAERANDHTIALERYLTAEKQLDVRRRRSTGPDAKLSGLSTLNVSELFLGLSRVSLKCSKAHTPISVLTRVSKESESIATWEQAALAFLERGRARTLLESLAGTSNVSANPDDQANLTLSYKQRLLTFLRSIPSARRDSETQQELAELELVMEDFKDHTTSMRLDPTTDHTTMMGDLYRCLDEHTLCVELGFSAYESVFIAATASDIQYVEVAGSRRQEIRDPVYRVMKGMNDYKKLHLERSEASDVKDKMQSLTIHISNELEKISDMILSPIANLVRSHRHIVFSVGHPFVAFPFAALPFDGKPLFLSAAVSTTPSLAVYARLSSRYSSFIPRVATITKHKLSKTEPPLPLAAIESMLIANDFNTWPHKARSLSESKFCKIVQDFTIVHIGTHGAIHADSPWLSYISLKKKFRVIDLSKVRSQAALVVFAACQSGLGKAEGDEKLGFANSVLETGAMAYLGALWEVDDVATMILMIYFYRAIRNVAPEPAISRRTLAELWRSAMRSFYCTDEAKAKDLIRGLIRDLDRCRQRGRDPDQIQAGAKEELLLLLQEEINVDFTHPFFYASFALTGFGGLVCESPGQEQDLAA